MVAYYIGAATQKEGASIEMKIRNILAGTAAGLSVTITLGWLTLILDIVLFIVALFTDAVVLTMTLANWCLLHKWIILPVLAAIGGVIGIFVSSSKPKGVFVGLLCGVGVAVAFGLVAALIDLIRYFIDLLVYAWGARTQYLPWYFSNFFVILLILLVLGTIGGLCYAYFRMSRDQEAHTQLALRNEVLKLAHEVETFCLSSKNVDNRTLNDIPPQMPELMETTENEFADFCVLIGKLDALTERLQKKGEKNP